MKAPTPDTIGLARHQINGQTKAVLNRGGWGNADVLLVETSDQLVIVKDYAGRSGFVRRWIGPWLLRREACALRRLEGVDAVPGLLGEVDALALIFEYRPGVLLSRSLAGRLPSRFLEELDHTIAEMHQRGVVHLDLRHRSNILAGEDGHPVVLDFASALRFDRATLWGRAAVSLLGRIDRWALQKWRVRLV